MGIVFEWVPTQWLGFQICKDWKVHSDIEYEVAGFRMSQVYCHHEPFFMGGNIIESNYKSTKGCVTIIKLHRYKKLKTVWRDKSIKKKDVKMIEGIKRVVGVICKHWVGLQSSGYWSEMILNYQVIVRRCPFSNGLVSGSIFAMESSLSLIGKKTS